ncbi:MAG TPA: hypothetical protein VI643_02410 [Planctomycetota bacterium]|nr:hypothetical protein [Planctomycetota bacterium]
MKTTRRPEPKIAIERTQTGVRIEKKMLKVLKALAEYYDMTLGEMLESIVLHAFEGRGANAFEGDSLNLIKTFKKAYGMDYDTHASDRFVEKGSGDRSLSV